MSKTVLVGISGGIDSKAGARALLEKGYDVCGIYIDMDGKGGKKAAEVCKELNIPFILHDGTEAFKRCVTDPFIEYYFEGKTPNPCVECNRYVKIQILFEISEKLGIDYISTGHFAGKSENGGRYAITKGNDLQKDQSYFLWKLTQEQIKKLIFPLKSSMKKDLIKDVSGYKESQDICFINGDYRDYLPAGSKKGYFVDSTGRRLSPHKGIACYTRGQRKGLGVALGYPAYVTDINFESGNITLGCRDDLGVKEFAVKALNFQGVVPFDGKRSFRVKTRYRATPVLATVIIEENIARVSLEEADYLVTAGQSAVFYDGDTVAFGGEICK